MLWYTPNSFNSLGFGAKLFQLGLPFSSTKFLEEKTTGGMHVAFFVFQKLQQTLFY
jgi:hypothetical protein